MDLFEIEAGQPVNRLPKEGEVYYFGRQMSCEVADNYYQKLLQSIEWKHDEALIYGKKIITRRKVAWYGDGPFKYTYSSMTKQALSWTCELLELKKMVEDHTQETFNSCLLNLYHDGSEGVSWHSDAERDLKKNGAIASLSFGAERKFSFKHKKDKTVVSLFLEHGGLLIMTGTTQKHWLHCIPISKKITTPRVSLTFRTIDGGQ